MGRLLLSAALCSLALASSALASAPLSDVNIKNPTLEVNAKGEALISYTSENGQPRHVLLWGAVNALPPTVDVPQVRFTRDYSGGWKSHQNPSYWKTFKDSCRPYDGPALTFLVAACKVADGSYWAIQSWQRKLPHRGFDPWQASQTAWSFDVSHWTGELAHLVFSVDWPKTFNFETEQIFGSLDYSSQPVHGFGTTRNGVPTDSYGRGVYIDTLDSAYGSGWKRETSIVFRNPSGSFCYSFYPTNDVSLPGRPDRPAGNGSRYRISVVGPGVTPDVEAEAAGLGKFNPAKDADLEQSRLALYDQITAGDKFCPTQR